MNQSKAIDMCSMIEVIAPVHGCHVALTGGCLYKTGTRKDVDILFYRIRQVAEIDKKGLFDDLEKHLGFKNITGFGWLHKAEWDGFNVDMFFPEEQEGDNYETWLMEQQDG